MYNNSGVYVYILYFCRKNKNIVQWKWTIMDKLIDLRHLVLNDWMGVYIIVCLWFFSVHLGMKDLLIKVSPFVFRFQTSILSLLFIIHSHLAKIRMLSRGNWNCCVCILASAYNIAHACYIVICTFKFNVELHRLNYTFFNFWENLPILFPEHM